MVLMSLRRRGAGCWSYVGLCNYLGLLNFAGLLHCAALLNLSARAPRTRTGFVSAISNATIQLFEQITTCAIVMVEKPLPVHLTSITEWWSGTRDLAGLVAAVTWHHGRWVAVAGCKTSNLSGSRTDGVILEVGHTF